MSTTKTVEVGSTPTLPSPPFISVSGVANFRDLGGYAIPSLPDHSVRTNIIYRCAEPSKVTPAGISKLQELGIKKAYDLRSIPEIERAKAAGYGGETEWEGCERVFAPVFEETDYSPEGLALRFKNYTRDGTEGFTLAYIEILENGPTAYGTIFRHLLNHPDSPLIIHCTAGKDRTGVICALLLSLCGVDDGTISDEYALTEIGLTEEWKVAVMAHLRENPILKGNEAGVRNLISARKENMEAFLKVLKTTFGGAEKYMVERCGLSDEEVQTIRKSLIVEKVARSN